MIIGLYAGDSFFKMAVDIMISLFFNKIPLKCQELCIKQIEIHYEMTR